MSDLCAIFINEQQSITDRIISVFDLGYTRGYGLFTTCRTYHGHPLFLDEHLTRLKENAHSLEMDLPMSLSQIKTLIFDYIGKFPGQDWVIKCILSGGPSMELIPEDFNSTLITTISPFSPRPLQHIKLKTVKISRHSPEIKTTQYLPAILELKKVQTFGFDDFIYCSEDGYLRESSTGNLFCIKKNTLITPKTKIFPGITRQAILSLASKDFAVVERDLHESEIETFDEAFITGSIKEIVPVTQMNHQRLSSLQPGSITSKIRQSYLDMAHEYALSHTSK